MPDVTQLLSAIESGDPRAADELLPLVYEELRRVRAQRQRHVHQYRRSDQSLHQPHLRRAGIFPADFELNLAEGPECRRERLGHCAVISF